MTEVLAHIDHAFTADHLAELDRELDTAALDTAAPARDTGEVSALTVDDRGPLVTTLAGLRSPVWYQ
jgi:hypothetical protein